MRRRSLVLVAVLCCGGQSALAVSPGFDPAHVAVIDGKGPFADFDAAAVNGPAAYLRCGPLTGLPLGEVGELVAWKDGKPFNPPSAADGRTYWRCHDPLPWLAALNDQSRDGALLSAVVQCAKYNLQPGNNMPPDGSISFAHKDSGKIGWENRVRQGLEGHWCNSVENAAYLSRLGHPRAKQVWRQWLELARAKLTAKPDWMLAGGAGNRDIGPHMVHLQLAFEDTGDPFWRRHAEAAAELMLSIPFEKYHQQNLGEVRLPYLLWQIKGQDAEPWIHEAWSWVRQNTSPESCGAFLTLAAVETFTTGDGAALRYAWPSLVNWRDSFYRSPGDDWDWGGRCPGRTGDLVSLQWPYVKAALLQAGLNDADLPRHSSVNTLPIETRAGKRSIVMIAGQDISHGTVRWQGSGGNVHGGTIYPVRDAAKFAVNKNQERQDFSHLHQPHELFDAFSFDQPFGQMAIVPQAGVNPLGPLTADPTEHCLLEAGKAYELGPCRGLLRTKGKVTIKPLSLYLSAFNQRGQSVRGFWAGKDPEASFSLTEDTAQHVDMRGPIYARWTLELSHPGTWHAVR